MDAVGCSISDGDRERSNRVRMHDFFDSRRAKSMDARHSTGTIRATLHSYGNGKQANEGAVVAGV